MNEWLEGERRKEERKQEMVGFGGAEIIINYARRDVSLLSL